MWEWSPLATPNHAKPSPSPKLAIVSLLATVRLLRVVRLEPEERTRVPLANTLTANALRHLARVTRDVAGWHESRTRVGKVRKVLIHAVAAQQFAGSATAWRSGCPRRFPSLLCLAAHALSRLPNGSSGTASTSCGQNGNDPSYCPTDPIGPDSDSVARQEWDH